MVERGLEGLEGGSDRRETGSTEMALWNSGHETGWGEGGNQKLGGPRLRLLLVGALAGIRREENQIKTLLRRTSQALGTN